jgi:ADP-ribose pyrophosphatase
MDADDVEILRRDTVYRGYLSVEKWQVRHRSFAGGWSAPVQREVVERGQAVGVLPYDPARDEVLLIEQFRPGAYGAGMNPWLIEVIAGIIEPDEALDDVVRREALEEAGCRVTELMPMMRCLVSPGILTESVALYCGRTETAGLGGIHGLAAEGEDIRAFVMALDAAVALVNEGKVTNIAAAVSVQWLALNRERVRQIWR